MNQPMRFKTRFGSEMEYIRVPVCDKYRFGIKFINNDYIRVPVTDKTPFGVRFIGEQNVFTGDSSTPCPFVSDKRSE